MPYDGVYVSPEDLLYIALRNLVATPGPIELRGRYVDAATGKSKAFDGLRAPIANTDGSLETTPFSFVSRDAYLQVLQAIPASSPTIDSFSKGGDLWAQIGVRKGRGALDLPLAQGYLTNENQVVYSPAGRTWEKYGEGPGSHVRIVGSNPAAGAEAVFTVPANTLWEIIAVEAALVASGTGNREVIFTIDDGTNRYAVYVPSALTQTDTQTIQYNWADYGSSEPRTAAQGTIARLISIPRRLKVGPANRIQTSTTNITAGDDWGIPVLYARRWVVGN